LRARRGMPQREHSVHGLGAGGVAGLAAGRAARAVAARGGRRGHARAAGSAADRGRQLRHPGAADPQAGAPAGGRRAHRVPGLDRGPRALAAAGHGVRVGPGANRAGPEGPGRRERAAVRRAGRRARLPGLHARRAQPVLLALRGTAGPGPGRPASRSDLGDHPCGRPPVRRQPGDPAARAVLRPGGPGDGHRRDRRVPARRGRAGPLPGPGRDAQASTGSRPRPAGLGRVAAGGGTRLRGSAGTRVRPR
jgi:hypothetical protein